DVDYLSKRLDGVELILNISIISKKCEFFNLLQLIKVFIAIFSKYKKLPLEQRAHFYTWASPVCALCAANSPDTPNVRAVLRHCVPNEGLAPLRCVRSYPSTLCGGNNLLTQTVPAAKSDNPIPSARPSTENVGGLFSSHPSYPPHQKGGHVPCPNR